VFRPCGANEYCDFANNSCGAGDQSGICRQRPEICPDIFAPVCACDGKVYPNACVANRSGLDSSARNTCQTPR
jgi:hypothetical protein